MSTTKNIISWVDPLPRKELWGIGDILAYGDYLCIVTKITTNRCTATCLQDGREFNDIGYMFLRIEPGTKITIEVG
jgi:hypothetical protein